MRTAYNSVISGFGGVVSGVNGVVSGVGTLSRAVSTTVLDITTEDDNLDDFNDREFNDHLKLQLEKELHGKRKRRMEKREKELSIDSGVSTDPLYNDAASYRDEFVYEQDGGREQVTAIDRQGSISSSLSVSSEDDFEVGLNFFNNSPEQRQQLHQIRSDEITNVTDDILSTEEDDDEFSLGTVDITSTEIFQARQRNQSAESRTLRLSKSLNHSGNLSDLRFRTSFTDSLRNKSRSSMTLSTLTDNSTPRNLFMDDMVMSHHTAELVMTSASRSGPTPHPEFVNPPQRSTRSLDKTYSKSEMCLNTIREKTPPEKSVRFNNYQEHQEQDPTTIESFESLSDNLLEQDTRCDTLSEFDDDDDLLEKKDPFRDSFNVTGPQKPGPKNAANNQDLVSLNHVMRKTFHNFNVGDGKTGESRFDRNLNHSLCRDENNESVIETISEISGRSKSLKSCSIARKTPVKLKPLPQIKAKTKDPGPKPRLGVNRNSAETSRLKTLSGRFEGVNKSGSSQPASKRKNHLVPPSESKTVSKHVLNIPSSPAKDSPRSVRSTPRSTSCTNLSRTDTHMTRSGTLDGFNSLDKTKSYGDLTFTPQQFATESSPTQDLAENQITLQNTSDFVSHEEGYHDNEPQSIVFDSLAGEYSASSSRRSSTSTFYSLSSNSDQDNKQDTPNVILNGKSSKTFMNSMKNSFKRLASFLSLSSSKKVLKGSAAYTPIPPPAHTKPETSKLGAKYRQQCVRPVSPSQVCEFTQRSKSCNNLNKNTVQVAMTPEPVVMIPGPPVRTSASGTDTLSQLSLDLSDHETTPRGFPDKRRKSEIPLPIKSNNYTINSEVGKQTNNKKKLTPSVGLMRHINSHYTGSNKHGFGSIGGVQKTKPVPKPVVVPKPVPKTYQSSPSFLPSPPPLRKPVWRETKASRLRLNRVKAPSMSALNL